MPFVALLVGAILIVAAFNNTHGDLAQQLKADIPDYFKWAAAILAILGLGYVPGLEKPSRWLLFLVALVLLLTNYQQIFGGFQNFLTGSGAAAGGGNPTPTSGYVQNPAAAPTPTQLEITGGGGSAGGGGGSAGGSSGNAPLLTSNPLDPSHYVAAIAQSVGFGGFA